VSGPDPDDPFGPTIDAGSSARVDPALAPTLDPASAGLEVPVDLSHLQPEMAGRYGRQGELGRGGMGRVLLAFDEQLGREVAMKELLIKTGDSSLSDGVSIGVVTRFLREARVTGQLEHPGIVPVHELGRRDDGTIYYTMKRIRGRAFSAVLAEARSIEERLELLIHFRHVCEAVAYAHSRGVVHRDLKPDNVMVGEFGETVIVDWGLAKVRGEDDPRAADVSQRVQIGESDGAASTIDGHAIGTPAYMSPEQARGELNLIDERSDVWSLGAMLFELLTGRAPHQGDKAVEVLQKVIDDRPPKVRAVEPTAPPELAAIADRALLRDASSRYPNAEALAAEIRAFQDGRQVHAYDYSSLEMIRRFVQRHRAASVAAVVISVAVIAMTAVAWTMYTAERDKRSTAESHRQAAVEQRDTVEAELSGVRRSFARSLLEHAEAALDDGDPAAAAIYAAGALLHDPANPNSPEHEERAADPEARRQAADRVARAFSAYLDAEDARRYVFVRRIDGASARGALSPDGRTLVYPAGAELAIERADHESRRALPIEADRVLAFLDEGRVVLAGDAAGVYSLESGDRLHALPESVTAAAPFEDRFAVALDDGTLRVLSADDYQTLGERGTAVRGDAGVDWAGGAHLVVGGHGRSRVERLGWPDEGESASAELPAASRVLAASPSGARIALGLADPLIAVLSRSPFELRASLSTYGEVSGLVWLSDELLATAEGADRVVVRNVVSEQRLDTLHVPRALGHRVVTGRRGGLLAVLPRLDASRVVEASVFRFERHRTRRTRPLDESVNDVRVDPARQRVIAATLRSLESFPLTRRGLGDRETLARLPPRVGHPARIAVARDGAIAVVTDLGALLLVTGDREPQTLLPPRGRARCDLGLAVGARGDVIYVGAADGTVRRWRRSRGREDGPIAGHEGPVCGLALGPSGDVLASAGLDGSVRIVSATSGALERAIERNDVSFTAVAFAPDGERLALAEDQGFVAVVRRADGSERARFRAHEGWISQVTWAPDGAHLATAGEDHTVRYVTSDGAHVLRVLRTSGPARSVEVSSRGGYLYYQDGPTVVRLATSAPVDARDPEALLRIAETRAGLRLDGLELVPAD